MAEKLNPKNFYGVDSDKTVSKLAERLSWLVAAIFVLLPFHAFFTSWAGNNFGHLDLFRLWKEIIILLIIPGAFFLAMRKNATKNFLKKSWIVRLFGIYILLHILLGAWALRNHNVNSTALAYSLITNLRFIGFFLVTYIVASYSNFLKKNIYKIVLIPAMLVVAVGLIQKLTLSHNLLGYFYGRGTIPPYQTIDGDDSLKRIQSTLRGANPLGAYLVLGFTLFATYIKQRYFRLSVLLGSSIVLFFSYSRSAWLGAIISLWLLTWWMLLKKHHRTWLISSIFVGAVLVGGTFYLFKSQPIAQDTLFRTSSSSNSPMSSDEARSIALKKGLNDVVHDPLGGGPGTAGPASFRNNHIPRIAENYFLQIGQEVGVLGMTIFITINVLVARLLWRNKQEILPKILLASFVGITFINLVSHAWMDDTLSYLWWGLAGIALAPAILGAKRKQNGTSN